MNTKKKLYEVIEQQAQALSWSDQVVAAENSYAMTTGANSGHWQTGQPYSPGYPGPYPNTSQPSSPGVSGYGTGYANVDLSQINLALEALRTAQEEILNRLDDIDRRMEEIENWKDFC